MNMQTEGKLVFPQCVRKTIEPQPDRMESACVSTAYIESIKIFQRL